MFVAESRIDELLRKHLDFKQIVAAFETAAELEVEHVSVIVAEDDILRVNVFDVFFLLLAILDVAVKFAVLGDGMSPEFSATARLLTDLELDALFLLILG